LQLEFPNETKANSHDKLGQIFPGRIRDYTYLM
jgi:hypothetical protein